MGCGASAVDVAPGSRFVRPDELVPNPHAVRLFRLGVLPGSKYAICDILRRAIVPAFIDIDNSPHQEQEQEHERVPSGRNGTNGTRQASSGSSEGSHHHAATGIERIGLRAKPRRLVRRSDCCWSFRPCSDGHVEIFYDAATPDSNTKKQADAVLSPSASEPEAAEETWVLAAVPSTGDMYLVSAPWRDAALSDGTLPIGGGVHVTSRWQLLTTALGPSGTDGHFVICLVPTGADAPARRSRPASATSRDPQSKYSPREGDEASETAALPGAPDRSDTREVVDHVEFSSSAVVALDATASSSKKMQKRSSIASTPASGGGSSNGHEVVAITVDLGGTTAAVSAHHRAAFSPGDASPARTATCVALIPEDEIEEEPSAPSGSSGRAADVASAHGAWIALDAAGSAAVERASRCLKPPPSPEASVGGGNSLVANPDMVSLDPARPLDGLARALLAAMLDATTEGAAASSFPQQSQQRQTTSSTSSSSLFALECFGLSSPGDVVLLRRSDGAASPTAALTVSADGEAVEFVNLAALRAASWSESPAAVRRFLWRVDCRPANGGGAGTGCVLVPRTRRGVKLGLSVPDGDLRLVPTAAQPPHVVTGALQIVSPRPALEKLLLAASASLAGVELQPWHNSASRTGGWPAAVITSNGSRGTGRLIAGLTIVAIEGAAASSNDDPSSMVVLLRATTTDVRAGTGSAWLAWARRAAAPSARRLLPDLVLADNETVTLGLLGSHEAAEGFRWRCRVATGPQPLSSMNEGGVALLFEPCSVAGTAITVVLPTGSGVEPVPSARGDGAASADGGFSSVPLLRLEPTAFAPAQTFTGTAAPPA